MEQRAQTWFGLGRLAALVALFGLLLGGVLPLPAHAMAPGGLADVPICQGGSALPEQHPAGHHQDGMCPSCCLFHCIHANLAMPANAPLPPPRVAAIRIIHGAHCARAPPALAQAAAYPRGPPHLA